MKTVIILLKLQQIPLLLYYYYCYCLNAIKAKILSNVHQLKDQYLVQASRLHATLGDLRPNLWCAFSFYITPSTDHDCVCLASNFHPPFVILEDTTNLYRKQLICSTTTQF